MANTPRVPKRTRDVSRKRRTIIKSCKARRERESRAYGGSRELEEVRRGERDIEVRKGPDETRNKAGGRVP